MLKYAILGMIKFILYFRDLLIFSKKIITEFCFTEIHAANGRNMLKTDQKQE